MATENNELDLFSLLPESLLLAIILNKKWLKIWQSGTDIDFDENFFVDSTSDEIKQAQREVFIDFITNWIAHFTQREIDKFSLKISNPRSCRNTIESCVEFAAQRRVKDFTLDFSDENNFNNNNNNDLFLVPRQVHLLGSYLESLKLSSCRFNMQDFLNFDALRDLSLSCIRIELKTLKTLLKNCKTIDSLSLEKCWGLKNMDLGYEPIWLTRLVVNKCEMNEYYISFDAPVLKYIKYSGLVITATLYALKLEEVDLDYSLESRYDSEHADDLCDVLLEFPKAKILTVCSYLLQVIPSANELMREASELKVKHLILNTQMHPNELGGLDFLLNTCTSMRKLTLNIGSGVIFEDYKPPYAEDPKKFWFDREYFPEIERLKVVEVNNSKATSSEFLFLCFLMHTAEVLEQVNIKICNADDGLTESRYERATTLKNNANSRFCHLQVSIY